MASRIARITARRRALVARSQALRAQLTLAAGSLRHELGVRQLGRTLLDTARRHPGVLIGGVVALISLRLRRIRGLAGLGGRSLGLVLRGVPVMATALRMARSFSAGGHAKRDRSSIGS